MSETSEVIRQRVQAARNIQQTRFGLRTLRVPTSEKQSQETLRSDIISNADMRIGEIRQFCQLQAEGSALSLSKCQSLMRVARVN